MQELTGARFHIERIANAAIVTGDFSYTGQPCFTPYAQATQGYEKCVSDAVDAALRNVFDGLRSDRTWRADTLVIPAIGTGTGHLPRDRFYKTVTDRLFDELGRKSPNVLPHDIYLQLWHKDLPIRWEETREGIATSVSNLVLRWRANDHARPDVGDTAALAGVSLSLALLLSAMAFNLRLPLPCRVHEALLRHPVLSAIGWCIAAQGSVATLKALVPVDVQPDNWRLYVALGVAATVACSFLLRSEELFKGAAKAVDSADR